MRKFTEEELTQEHTGIDMIQATIDVSFGLKPDLTPTLSCGSAIRFFDVPKGIIQSIEGIEQAYEIDGVKEITFTKQVGDAITDVHSRPAILAHRRCNLRPYRYSP